jgi:hypothetical protein
VRGKRVGGMAGRKAAKAFSAEEAVTSGVAAAGDAMGSSHSPLVPLLPFSPSQSSSSVPRPRPPSPGPPGPRSSGVERGPAAVDNAAGGRAGSSVVAAHGGAAPQRNPRAQHRGPAGQAPPLRGTIGRTGPSRAGGSARLGPTRALPSPGERGAWGCLARGRRRGGREGAADVRGGTRVPRGQAWKSSAWSSAQRAKGRAGVPVSFSTVSVISGGTPTVASNDFSRSWSMCGGTCGNSSGPASCGGT